MLTRLAAKETSGCVGVSNASDESGDHATTPYGCAVDEFEIAVRSCVDADLDAIRLIHARQSTETLLTASPAESGAWARMMDNDEMTIYLAESGDTPVGTATLMLMPNITYACAPTAFIEAVVVVPDMRRRGIARLMLKRAIEDARTAGCDKVQLLSHKRHLEDGAHDLYRGLGFAAEAEGFRRYLLTQATDRAEHGPT